MSHCKKCGGDKDEDGFTYGRSYSYPDAPPAIPCVCAPPGQHELAISVIRDSHERIERIERENEKLRTALRYMIKYGHHPFFEPVRSILFDLGVIVLDNGKLKASE